MFRVRGTQLDILGAVALKARLWLAPGLLTAISHRLGFTPMAAELPGFDA